MHKAITVNDKTVTSVISPPGIALVEFWASWCPPCKMLEPVLEQLARELPDVRIAKINVDQNPLTASLFGISGVPTFILFSNGTERARRVGAQSKKQLHEFIGYGQHT